MMTLLDRLDTARPDSVRTALLILTAGMALMAVGVQWARWGW